MPNIVWLKNGNGDLSYTRKVTLTNLVKDGSFESGSPWVSGYSPDASEHIFGNKANKLSDTTIAQQALDVLPIVGHKYYGREYIKSSGEIGAADMRFEIHGGDGVGLNWVFGLNSGNFANWSVISNIQTIDAVNASSYNIRSFVVAAQNPAWIDGVMVIDLTEAFGAGKEPDKEWCDNYIPWFDGTIQLSLKGG